ncbi:hypothetical protein CDL15_Pgr009352 [Punica granatum]|uniref:Uncharacterized protein n=1 Tax=Punica granatum TaxID=22663 RepID=A0A218XFU3_PUNGR|nr:hypothetical protein CDL15_Pgr009352 [Punica granatum]PKI51005.1 hypothetical protein CRG98_028602 [Punica granatum]
MGMCPMLKENDMKMLHMNTPLGGWRECRTLTSDHNVLADLLVKENEELRKIKKELKIKIKMFSATPFAPFPPSGHSIPCSGPVPSHPKLHPWPNSLLIGPCLESKSLEVAEPKGNDPGEEN